MEVAQHSKMDDGKNLPPITLSTTTLSSLMKFIPLLVCITTKTESPPTFENEKNKPNWWPQDVPWMSPLQLKESLFHKEEQLLKVLRRLVLSCYTHHGVEELLCTIDNGDIDGETDSMDIISLIDDAEEEENSINEVEPSSADVESPVFVCCFCLEQYSSHSEVSTHQDVCQKRSQSPPREEKPLCSMLSDGEQEDSPNAMATVSPSLPRFNNSGVETTAVASETSVHVVPSFFSEGLVNSQSNAPTVTPVAVYSVVPKPQRLNNHAPNLKKSEAALPFVPILKTRSQKKLDSIMEKHNSRRMMLQECNKMKYLEKKGAWWRQRSKQTVCSSPRHPGEIIPVKTFAAGLGLAFKSDLIAVPKKEEVDLDCEIIAVEGPISMLPPPPNTSTSPRTAKTLMSQLSRDDSSDSRRRISFCFVEDEWADREAIEGGKQPVVNSLLSLDFSSPLGQRVKKYVKGEGLLNIVKDVESYCKTEIDEDSYSKLRGRGLDYKVTFRRKRRGSAFVHKYKFNRKDVLEFKRLLKTGLSARSRRLKRLIRPCKLVLKRLKESEIKYWTEKKITIADKIYYDDDICITQIDIPHSALEKANKVINSNSIPGSSSSGDKKILPHSGNMSAHNHHCQHRPHSLSRSQHPSQGTSSPPHVPNIFRNRPAHMSLGQRPPGLPSERPPGLPVSSRRPPGYGPKSHKMHSHIHHPSCTRAVTPGTNRPVPAVSSYTNTGPEIPRISQPHPSTGRQFSTLPRYSGKPSGYNSPSEERSGSNCSPTVNRRKQSLTDVRREDFGENTFRLLQDMVMLSNSKNLSHPLPHPPTGPFSQRNNTFLSQPEPQRPAQGNYDHISIRNGKVHSGHTILHKPSQPADNVLSNHHKSSGSASCKVHGNLRAGAGPLKNHHSLSPSIHLLGNHSRLQVANVQNAPQKGAQLPTSTTGNKGAAKPSVNTCVKNTPATHLSQPQLNGDDDVLEVICIDDD